MKSISSRLIIGLGLIIAFFIAQAGLVWWSQSNARTEVVDTARKNTIASSQLGELSILAQQIRRYEKEYFVYVGNQERRNGYIKEWSNTGDKITKLIGTMRTNTDRAFTSDDVSKMVNWNAAADFYSTEMKKIFELVNARAAAVAQATAAAPVAVAKLAAKPAAAASTSANTTPTEVLSMFNPAEVNTMIGAGKDRFSDVLIKGTAAMTTEKTKQTLALSEVAAGGFNQVLQGVLLTVAVGIAIALALLLTLPKTVTVPLASLTDAINEMSKGKLDTKIETSKVKEFEGLTTALERMRLGQQALVARMRRTT